MSVKFGTVRQLGYVVRNLKAAVDYWTQCIGVGPFFLFATAPVHDLRYKGNPTDAKVTFALAQSGSVQIELIAPLDDHPSVFREHLNAYGEGLHHVAYWTTDFAALSAEARAAGMEEVQSGYTGDAAGRFAYFAGAAHPGSCIEISALSAPKRKLFDDVARAALSWDGAPESAIVRV
ncbi:MAG: VOC family protein [Alcaligenaceae bacterium]|nr:MAG: VOC family protein [Alcaligenaceae bacterium]